MKKFIATLLLVVTITTVTSTKKADAIIGLIFQNRVFNVIGALGAINGGISYGIGYGNIGISIGFGLTYGLLLSGIGLIILDDGQVADIEFKEIPENSTEVLKQFTSNEIAIYNSEVELLNAVRQTIISETASSDNTEESEKLWLEYSDSLSPETFEIAKAQAEAFLKKLKK